MKRTSQRCAQGLVEYALIVIGIGLMAISALSATGGAVKDTVQNMNHKIGTAASPAPKPGPMNTGR